MYACMFTTKSASAFKSTLCVYVKLTNLMQVLVSRLKTLNITLNSLCVRTILLRSSLILILDFVLQRVPSHTNGGEHQNRLRLRTVWSLWFAVWAKRYDLACPSIFYKTSGTCFRWNWALLCICFQSTSSLESNLEGLAGVLEADLPNYKNKILRILCSV